VFGLRLAIFELTNMLKNGIPEAEFQKTRTYLSKYVNILTKTKSAELGYAIDSLYYGIPNYNEYVKNGLAKLTAADVNAAIRRHLRAENLQIVGVAKDAETLRAALTGSEATPIHYNSEKPQAVLDEDKIVERFPLGLRKEDVAVVPVDSVFQN
jgi:zinc protease